MEIIKSS